MDARQAQSITLKYANGMLLELVAAYRVVVNGVLERPVINIEDYFVSDD